MTKTIFLLCPLLVLFASADPIPSTDYSHPLDIGGNTFQAEIADTPRAMRRGMMYRRSMNDRQAMLFVYAKPRQAIFWMKNTLIALDMLFFDERGVLVEIKRNIPPCQTTNCPIYPSKAHNIQFVVEIKGGGAQQFGLTTGARLHVAR